MLITCNDSLLFALFNFKAYVAKIFSYLQAEVENVPSDIYEYLDKIDKDDEEGEESQVIKIA